MTSPITPEVCETTGRLLTEWFEFPEFTDEQLRRKAHEEYGVDPENPPKHVPIGQERDEESMLSQKIAAFIRKRKSTKWRGGMSKQEVQHRLNEATKMINPDNFKFLPEDVRERTGLELNPLWMMEALVRSGTLTPKEQVQALKELAGYTHSKAPSISHSTTTQMKPEDWLLELAKEEYTVIEPEKVQPKTPVEKGFGKNFERTTRKKQQVTEALTTYTASELEALEAEVEDFDIEGYSIDDG